MFQIQLPKIRIAYGHELDIKIFWNVLFPPGRFLWFKRKGRMIKVWQFPFINIRIRGGGGGSEYLVWGESTLCHRVPSREYWIIYRGPGFLAVFWFGHSPRPLPPPAGEQVVSLSQSSCVSPVELTDGIRERGGVDEEPNHTTRESLDLYKSFNTLWYLSIPLYGVFETGSCRGGINQPW